MGNVSYLDLRTHWRVFSMGQTDLCRDSERVFWLLLCGEWDWPGQEEDWEEGVLMSYRLFTGQGSGTGWPSVTGTGCYVSWMAMWQNPRPASPHLKVGFHLTSEACPSHGPLLCPLNWSCLRAHGEGQAGRCPTADPLLDLSTSSKLCSTL